MAQTSTTLSGEKSHMSTDITGTDISISTSGTISSTGTIIADDGSTPSNGKLAVRDLVTITGTTNNNSTFTVKEVISTTEFTVEETITTGDDADGSSTFTLDMTGFVTDKAKGDGYYSQPDGVHTVAYHVNGSINDDEHISIKMQGTLATTPTEDDWFDIEGTSIGRDNIDGSTLAFSSNFTGNFVWVRAKVSGMSAGAVSKILYNN